MIKKNRNIFNSISLRQKLALKHQILSTPATTKYSIIDEENKKYNIHDKVTFESSNSKEVKDKNELTDGQNIKFEKYYSKIKEICYG